MGDQTSFGTWNAARAAQFGCGFLAGNPALRYVHPENIGSIHFPPPAEVEEASSSSQQAASCDGTSMEIKAFSLTTATPIAVAFGIFVVDVLVHVDVAIPVLYVAVVLMSVRLYEVHGVLIVSLGCAVLTVVGYLLSPGNPLGTTALANRFLALLRSAPRLSLL